MPVNCSCATTQAGEWHCRGFTTLIFPELLYPEAASVCISRFSLQRLSYQCKIQFRFLLSLAEGFGFFDLGMSRSFYGTCLKGMLGQLPSTLKLSIIETSIIKRRKPTVT